MTGPESFLWYRGRFWVGLLAVGTQILLAAGRDGLSTLSLVVLVVGATLALDGALGMWRNRA